VLAKGASSVLATGSSRFADAEFGFGAEIGISTQKLHARVRCGRKQDIERRQGPWSSRMRTPSNWFARASSKGRLTATETPSGNTSDATHRF
jgi:hypothetical protein